MASTNGTHNYIEGDYVFVRGGELRLLFPLDDVADTTYSDAQKDAEKKPRVAISEYMQLLSPPPEDRFILTHLRGANVQLCWNEMIILMDQKLVTETIPSQFLEGDTPLRTLTMINSEPTFVCESMSFLAYLFKEPDHHDTVVGDDHE